MAGPGLTGVNTDGVDGVAGETAPDSPNEADKRWPNDCSSGSRWSVVHIWLVRMETGMSLKLSEGNRIRVVHLEHTYFLQIEQEVDQQKTPNRIFSHTKHTRPFSRSFETVLSRFRSSSSARVILSLILESSCMVRSMSWHRWINSEFRSLALAR